MILDFFFLFQSIHLQYYQICIIINVLFCNYIYQRLILDMEFFQIMKLLFQKNKLSAFFVIEGRKLFCTVICIKYQKINDGGAQLLAS